jgi:hypothetical protein
MRFLAQVAPPLAVPVPVIHAGAGEQPQRNGKGITARAMGDPRGRGRAAPGRKTVSPLSRLTAVLLPLGSSGAGGRGCRAG